MKHLRLLPFLIAPLVARYGHIGTGIERLINYKKETTNGTIASNTGGQQIRRVTFGLKLQKDTFSSNEKLAHRQDQTFRHGMRKSAGPIAGEYSPGTYCDWVDSALRRNRTAVTAIAALTLTVAISGSEYTITATAGPNFLTSGLKNGLVVRITAGAVNANNLNKNILIRTVTGTVITGRPLNPAFTLTAEGPIASCTVSIPGKYSFAPATGHTDDAYTIEDLHPLLATPKSEQHIGCKVNTYKFTAPASGICLADFDFLGQDFARTNAAYFGSPAAQTTTDVVASTTATYLIGGAYNTDVTNLDFTLNSNVTSAATGGSVIAPNVFIDRIQASGTLSAFLEDGTLRDFFVDEVETDLVVIYANSLLANADFVSYMFPRVKFNDAGKDDPNTGISQSIPWKALYNSTGGSGQPEEQTTLAYQDSAAT